MGFWLLVWNAVGFVIIIDQILEGRNHCDGKCILRPDVVYEALSVNYFGCAVITIIINLLCPVVSISYWLIKFIGFIFTVGRDDYK